MFICSTDQFQQLLSLLQKSGYQLVGPAVRGEAIVYEEIESAKDLPVGWMDEQDAGYYRLKRRNDSAFFGYNLGPHSWKKFLFPPQDKLYSFCKKRCLSVTREIDPPVLPRALIGVRACELRAIQVQDKVFGAAHDCYEQYQKRREQLFIIAVQCTKSVSTCFCASMGSGPSVKEGFDLCLTELIEEGRHYFVIQAGERGESFCKMLDLREAGSDDVQAAEQKVESNRAGMKRHVDNGSVHGVLMKSWDSERWDKVASRCVNCANCTMVCPTCFCSETIDRQSIQGGNCDRWQCWDSCFNLSHSYIHGGYVRQSDRSRYRQWLTHKFGSWHDQFGESGCVGCGRCIAWCPMGIDVTQELHELQKREVQKETES
jgi:sulfhydrogenase subunit beta (sulfur reductase)